MRLIATRTLLASTLAVVSFGAFGAQTALPENSLSRLFDNALLHDKAYRSALAKSRADKEAENQGLAALLPVIGAGAQFKSEDSDRSAFGRTVNSRSQPKAYTVTLSQPLFRMEAWESYKQGKLAATLAGINALAARQDLLLRLSQSYFDVLAARDSLDTIKVQKEATAQQLASAKRNFEIGTATITDQQEAQARYDLIVAQELAISSQMQVAQLKLGQISGMRLENPPRLAEEAQISAPEPVSAEAWALEAVKGNLQIKQADLGVEISQGQSRKATYGHLPTLDLQADYLDAEQQIFDTTTGQPFDVEQKSTTVGVVLSVPIFAGGFTQSKAREAQELLNQAREDRALVRESAQLQARAAFINVQTGLAQVQALETAVKSSELALQANKTGYEVGVRINIDVLNAQQQLSSARQNLFKAKYETLLAMLQLQAACGRLTDSSLQQLDSLFSH